MSKKKKINKGSFYYSYWGEPHPAQIYEVDKKYKTYKSIRFGTTKRKHMTEIRPIQKGIKKSYVKIDHLLVLEAIMVIENYLDYLLIHAIKTPLKK